MNYRQGLFSGLIWDAVSVLLSAKLVQVPPGLEDSQSYENTGSPFHEKLRGPRKKVKVMLIVFIHISEQLWKNYVLKQNKIKYRMGLIVNGNGLRKDDEWWITREIAWWPVKEILGGVGWHKLVAEGQDLIRQCLGWWNEIKKKKQIWNEILLI